jgi:hypothetical protein
MPAILSLLLGIYALWIGWLRLRDPSAGLLLLTVPEMAALVLVRAFRGAKQAIEKRRELLHPSRLRRTGYIYLSTGAVFVTLGLVQLGILLMAPK